MKFPENLRTSPQAYTLIEVLVSGSILGILFVALYSGMSSGFAAVQLSRENLRATQIMQEKMETIRLYRWDQINTPGFIPPAFTEYFFATSEMKSGINYSGTVTISDPPLTESYKNDLKMVTVQLTWESGRVTRSREMVTYVSRYGLQHYIY